ncbi:MAG: c-type cytochrome [Chitinophagales bacterium]
MRTRLYLFSALLIVSSAFYIVSCNSGSNEKKDTTTTEKKQMSQEDMIKRGNYLMITSGCHDCHSPKKFGPRGEMTLDSSKLLSGHPGEIPMPPVNLKSLEPGQWMSMSGDLTAFVGPWGLSYTANLTPDSATGTGAWSEEQFINTLRNGKHLGNGRPIMPPMPWQFISQINDDDLKAIFAFLKSLPPVKNVVHAPFSPDEVRNMSATK